MKPRYRNPSGDDLFQTLLRFHREIALPDMQRLIDNQTKRMNAHFDRVETRFHDLFARLDRYQSELISLRADFDRVGTTTASPTSPLVTSNRA
jgi:hypothetical protein